MVLGGVHSNLQGYIFSLGLCNFALQHFQYLQLSSHFRDTSSNITYNNLPSAQMMVHYISFSLRLNHLKDQQQLVTKFSQFSVKVPYSFMEKASMIQLLKKDKMFLREFFL